MIGWCGDGEGDTGYGWSAQASFVMEKSQLLSMWVLYKVLCAAKLSRLCLHTAQTVRSWVDPMPCNMLP